MMNALRPAYLVNSGGGVIRWNAWLKRPIDAHDGFELAAMVFTDGSAVDREGRQTSLDVKFGGLAAREEMRDFARTSRFIHVNG